MTATHALSYPAGGPQAIVIGLEIGTHNGVLALGIALSPQLLNNAEMAIPAAVYGIIALFVALAFIFTNRRLDPAFRDPGRPRSVPTESSAPFKDPQEDPASGPTLRHPPAAKCRLLTGAAGLANS